MGLLLAGVAQAQKLSDEAIHGDAEEHKWVSFVEAHPEIDFATFRVMTNSPTRGIEMVTYAASRNYLELLGVLEEKGGAVSRFQVGPTEFSPVRIAMACDADEVLPFLLRERPDWIAQAPDGMDPPVVIALNISQTNQLTILLDAGADINSRGQDGRTLLQFAAFRSVELFDLIRRRGGKSAVLSQNFMWGKEVIQGLINKYSDCALHLYDDRIQLANGDSIPFFQAKPPWLAESAAERVRPDTADEQATTQLVLELKKAGAKNNGTLFFIVHPNSDNLNYLHLEPILERLNLAALYVPDEGFEWGTLRQWYVPSIGSEEGASSGASKE